MNVDLIFFVVFTAFIAYMIFLIRRSYMSNRIVDDGSEKADTDIMAIPYRGEFITMTNIEYLNNWQHMNREQKNTIYNNQMAQLKNGFIERRYISDTEYVIESTGKDRRATAARALKDKIYKTGV